MLTRPTLPPPRWIERPSQERIDTSRLVRGTWTLPHGGLDREEMCLDLVVEAWWKPYSGETDDVWQTRFSDYLEELARNRVPDKTVVTLLQKHHKRPFVEIYLDNESEPDCGPEGVSGGDIGDDYASLADLLGSNLLHLQCRDWQTAVWCPMENRRHRGGGGGQKRSVWCVCVPVSCCPHRQHCRLRVELQ